MIKSFLSNAPQRAFPLALQEYGSYFPVLSSSNIFLQKSHMVFEVNPVLFTKNKKHNKTSYGIIEP